MRLVVNDSRSFYVESFEEFLGEFRVTITLPIKGVEISNGTITIKPKPETELNG